MRDGNRDAGICLRKGKKVFKLPMRDGNKEG